jgi:hypothetical protein
MQINNLIFGDANQQVKDMYEGWIDETAKSEGIAMPNEDLSTSEVDQDLLEAYEEMHKEYLKKVH